MGKEKYFQITLREHVPPKESRIAFAFAFLIILAVIGIGQACFASPLAALPPGQAIDPTIAARALKDDGDGIRPDDAKRLLQEGADRPLPGGQTGQTGAIYRAESTRGRFRIHGGWGPHLHTRGHTHPIQWRTLASMEIPDLSLPEQTGARQAGGGEWSVSAEVAIRYHQSPTLSFAMRVLACSLKECEEIMAPRISWIRKGKYFVFSRSAHWAQSSGEEKTVFLQVRLLSIPREGRQGHKVFFKPGEQWISMIRIYRW